MSVSVRQLCVMLAVSRSWYYAARARPAADETALRDALERIVLEFAGYGYRRVTKALAREGWLVNHKRVLRVMREESLLCQLKRRWVPTTDSDHGLATYPNLVRHLRVAHLNQVWVADITSIRLPQGFVYRAPILDA
ncbi:MAG: IS3 family transposase [Chloroflexota bacterium]